MTDQTTGHQPITADDLDRMEARVDAATEGPWIYESSEDIHGGPDDHLHYVTPRYQALDDDHR